MRILITGSRTWTDREMVYNLLEAANRKPGPHTLVHGGARGADTIAGQIAAEFGWTVEVHEADWGHDGRAAGVLRNNKMVNLGADLCLAFIMNNSPGASHCARLARMAGINTAKFHRPALTPDGEPPVSLQGL
jgi:hypothetical protein